MLTCPARRSSTMKCARRIEKLQILSSAIASGGLAYRVSRSVLASGRDIVKLPVWKLLCGRRADDAKNRRMPTRELPRLRGRNLGYVGNRSARERDRTRTYQQLISL